MNKKILIIKTGKTVSSVPAKKGDFEHWIIAGTGITANQFETVNVFEDKSLPELEKIRGIFITGSPAMVTDSHPWIKRTIDYVQHAMTLSIPMLGICFGHQLLAKSLEGLVDFHPQGREIGTTWVQLTAAAMSDPLFRGLPEQFPVNVSHSQSVLKPPASAQLLAYNDFEAHQGLRFNDTTWGVQFHPEFDGEVMLSYINERYQDIRNEGLDPDLLLAETLDVEISATILKNFAQLIQ